jgi:hypothetical protein
MATTRSSGYSIGNTPPFITWTVVRGDSASFRVYVTDDARVPLNIDNWNIEMEIKRPTTAQATPTITDAATLIITLNPEATGVDDDGEFTVTLEPEESVLLRTGDIFDIELSDATRVWTVAQGSMIILEDVTNSVVS